MDIPTSTQATKRQLTAHYSSYSLFDDTARQQLEGIVIAALNPNVRTESAQCMGNDVHNVTEITSDLQSKLVVADCMSCNCCQAQFADRDEQIEHYKCDWHRYNLHLRLRGMPNVIEEEFEKISGDVSSISGSDDDENEQDKTACGRSREGQELILAETPLIEDEGSSSMAERKFLKVFFRNSVGNLISVYRCLLHHKKNPLTGSEDLVSAVGQLPGKMKWMVLMMSAGHFAGAVFNGKQVTEHKTFHRYTVRAKRGSAQSTRDNQGSVHKSAGSSLRRHNELALTQDIQELLANWSEHLKACDFIFVRIPVANRGTFYAGKSPALRKDDPRIRVIPFATRRPTFSEVKRVQYMLASLECYGQEADVGDIIPLSPPRILLKETGLLEVREPSTGNRTSKIKDVKETSQPASQESPDPSASIDHEEAVEDEVDMDLVETMEMIDFSDLKPFEHSPKKRQHKKKKTSAAKVQTSRTEDASDERTLRWRNSVFTACKVGNVDVLIHVFEEMRNSSSSSVEECNSGKENEDSERSLHSRPDFTSDSSDGCVRSEDKQKSESPTGSAHQSTPSAQNSYVQSAKPMSAASEPNVSLRPSSHMAASFLNTPVNDAGTTFLHLAAKEGHHEVVTALLEAGADPAIRDKSGKTPYNLGDSEVRNAFRRFMARFPDRYDYATAQVPSPLTFEMEAEKKQKLAEKRKAKKKALQERNKDKKAAEAKVREENQEKERFLALSDREKRALAAERRLLQQHNDNGQVKPVLSRCWQCGSDTTGKVPFEYADFKFCTTKCLREHRSQHKS